MRPLRILTWHVHSGYLYYLTQCRHQFYLPVKLGCPEGCGGQLNGFPWSENVREVSAETVRDLEFDCVLFQSKKNYLDDQYEILSESQRQLPRIYLEHDPPQEYPTNSRHIVDDPNVLLVHVTPFSQLMWDNGHTPTCVIEHGVVAPEGVQYTGELFRGLAVVNELGSHGRRLGVDVFQQVRSQVPLDLVGRGATDLNGLGEIPHMQLPFFQARYRFFFNPARHNSLGLALCEAMAIGMPIVGLATAELVTVVENGVSGYIDTNVDCLVQAMRELLYSPAEARRLGAGARRLAQERFGIRRFIDDWERAFESAMDTHSQSPAALISQNPLVVFSKGKV
jgi:glycosyltransferase involved in cell wall biosynthesis